MVVCIHILRFVIRMLKFDQHPGQFANYYDNFVMNVRDIL